MTTAVTNTDAAARAAVRSRRRWSGRWLDRVVAIAACLAVWELLPRAGIVSSHAMAPFSSTMSALGSQITGSALWSAVAETMKAWIIGLAIAVVCGVVLGVVIGIVPGLRSVTSSSIEFLRPIPSVALIPLAVLLYGTGIKSTLLLVVYACFWQVLIQVLYGVQDVDPVVLDTARSYQLGPMARVRHVIWPTALPYVMTGVRLAATVALVLAITAELAIGTPGLGSALAVSQSSGAVANTYALVVVTGILGLAVNMLARAVERRALAWHPSMRTEVAA